MAHDSTNPFLLPGFGQKGDSAHNPLFAGLDMMRQAWQNMATAGSLEAAAMPAMSIEDLDKRIRELQTVQNWLQLNASMLASTIQGLEIQRSTLATLKSFADSALADKPAGGDAGPNADGNQPGQAYAQAATDWWAMVQQQFDQLLTATAASVKDAEAKSDPAPRKKAAAAKPSAGAASGTRSKTGKAAKPKA